MSELSWIEPSLRPLAIPLEAIRPDPHNVRLHDERNLSAIRLSLSTFGQQKPIVIDNQGICLAGNGALRAAHALGWTHIAAIRTGLAGAAARAYAIADNRTGETSAWDPVALAEQLARLQNDDAIDEHATGFSDDDIQACIDQATGLADDPTAADSDAGEGVDPAPVHQLLVACSDEADQRDLYERLAGEGYACRVLTL